VLIRDHVVVGEQQTPFFRTGRLSRDQRLTAVVLGLPQFFELNMAQDSTAEFGLSRQDQWFYPSLGVSYSFVDGFYVGLQLEYSGGISAVRD
jgi:hypothetical protein